MDPEVLKETNALLAKITETLNNIPALLSNVNSDLGGSGEAVSSIGGKISDVTQKSEKMGEVFKRTSNQIVGDVESANYKITKLEENIRELVGINFDSLVGNTGLVNASLSVIGTALFDTGEGFSNFKDSIESVGKSSSDIARGDMHNLSSSLEKLAGNPILKKIPFFNGLAGSIKTLTGALGSIYGSVKNLQDFENAIMNTRASFAGFQEEGSRIKFIQNLDTEVARFNDIIENTANSLNLSNSEIEKYAQTLMKIPGAFDNVSQGAGDVNRSVRLLEDSIRITRGTTGDFAETQGVIAQEMKLFNTSAETSLDTMSRLYELSNAIGAPFKDFKESVDKIVEGFDSLGNTSKSATDMVSNLGKALMNTGLGIGPTRRIIDSITGSMQEMGLAQKAFLSQQTGGPGGLMGALQIDEMIAGGDVQGVYKKMEEAIRKQFGGRIVTREEGAQSNLAAQDFVRQSAFLKQGPFGAMVKSDSDADRLLRAFKEGTIDQELIQRGQDALKNAQESDKQIQEKQRDVLVDLSNSTKMMFREAQIQTALIARSIMGSGRISDIMKMAEDAASARAATAGSTPEILSGRDDLFSKKGMSEKISDLAEKVSKISGELASTAVNKSERAFSSSPTETTLPTARDPNRPQKVSFDGSIDLVIHKMPDADGPGRGQIRSDVSSASTGVK